MYADGVACCPLVSHVVYAQRALLTGQTDEQTPDRNITLCARSGQRPSLSTTVAYAATGIASISLDLKLFQNSRNRQSTQ